MVYSRQKHDKTVVQERGVIDISESLIVDILLGDGGADGGECSFTMYLPDRTWYFCAESLQVATARPRVHARAFGGSVHIDAIPPPRARVVLQVARRWVIELRRFRQSRELACRTLFEATDRRQRPKKQHAK